MPNKLRYPAKDMNTECNRESLGVIVSECSGCHVEHSHEGEVDELQRRKIKAMWIKLSWDTLEGRWPSGIRGGSIQFDMEVAYWRVTN